MGMGYQNPNASKTIDVIGNLDAKFTSTPLVTTATKVICLASLATYGTQTDKFKVVLPFDLTGASPTANYKVRAIVNGTLAKEQTYEADGFYDDFVIDAGPEDKITYELSSNLTAGTVEALCQRAIVLAAAAAPGCSC